MGLSHQKVGTMNDRPPVLTKKDFVRRYQNGEFGNASPTWDSLDSWLMDNARYKYADATDPVFSSLWHIRNRVASGPTYYDLAISTVEFRWTELLRRGVKPQNLYISAMAPTALTLFQGEVCQSTEYLWLTYSTLPFTMREALAKQTRLAYGIMAVRLLQHYMDDNSYGWLEHLLETYPGHVVEFSVYSKPWGTIPHHNTVYWEVRNY